MQKSLLLVILMTCAALVTRAQDIHFSQFYASPLNLNPALTGVMNCTDRLTMVYRNQWASVLKSNAFNTIGVSYDRKNTVGRNDYWGFGVNLWADRAGELNFATVSPQIAASYSKKMGGSRKSAHYLSFGVEGGASNRSIDFSLAKWGLQGKDGVHHPDFPSNENEANFDKSFWFGELSAGLLWFSTFDEDNSFYVGGAFSHITKPNQSFLVDGPDVPLYGKITAHAGGDFAITDQLSLVPGVVTYFQGPSFQLNAGTSLRVWLDKSRWSRQDIQFGIWTRISNHWQKALDADAIILSTRLDYNQFTIGFSYDLNISSLTPASNYNGAVEFSLGYLICGPERRGVYCPTF
ncbi:MAG: PorP/SprF family type IX secretion system membrane protein [Saprospiraceae bacterium]|nr:PorP/SprF family type IX secretion system membrane protein [Candidatus Brachybacter algidus]MBK9025576.1 PorP/SprF family type IX secretion system membrane protein [Candidatus Brachybacter algidus]MBL0118334.1 PorP/SprF family type IX secretion system membrane protein [Candidatus Brachybacter algidus]